MKIKSWLNGADTKLQQAGIGTAWLDSLVLLADELSEDKSWILAHPEFELKPNQVKKLARKINRRAKHEPLAYIRGFSEFYGRKFKVNKNVLEPRPESEAMIDMLKRLDLPKKTVIADIGTGSGALAITAKLEVPEAEVIGVDIDPKCLTVARQNAKTLSAKVKFLKGDLLEPFEQATIDVILANLPYVPRSLRINQSATMEPKLAIDGGSDGLDVYRRLFNQLTPPGTTRNRSDVSSTGRTRWVKYVLTESLPPQHQNLADIAKSAGYKLSRTDDFIQLFMTPARLSK